MWAAIETAQRYHLSWAESPNEYGSYLQLLVELARRAGDENPAGDTAFAVFDPLYDAGGLAALGAVGAL
jgi:hypothetical protein